jgi:hypothetical protein
VKISCQNGYSPKEIGSPYSSLSGDSKVPVQEETTLMNGRDSLGK